MTTESLPRDEKALAALVASFEDETLSFEVWRAHETHLLVSLAYLLGHPLAEATERIREGIQRFNAAHGVAQTPTGGYHETITRAWIRLIDRYLAEVGRDRPVGELIAGLMARHGDTRELLTYYSRERLMSWEARTGWVAPDLQAL